ncbi:MAG: hypothetical protein QM727_12540 [Niabella sp.]
MKNIMLCLCITICANCFSQKDISTYKIQGLGQITVSNLLELQSGEIKKLANKYYQTYSIPYNNRIVFQQAGLNDRNPQSLNTYARIIIQEINGDKEIFNEYKKHIVDFDNQIKQETKSALGTQNAKLLSWEKSILTNLNGKSAISCSYTRQFPNNPVTLTKIYFMETNNSIYKINLEYWLKDKETWSSILTNAIRTFKIQQ